MTTNGSVELIEIARNVVRALDEIERDLKALGRNPVYVHESREKLLELEHRLMSEMSQADQALTH